MGRKPQGSGERFIISFSTFPLVPPLDGREMRDADTEPMEFIDLKTQYRRLRAEIDQRLGRVLEHGHFIMGPEVPELEQTLAGYVGVSSCISVASGTVSLEIALRALGIGPGDEVITVPFTWISTAEVICLVGATPVFV